MTQEQPSQISLPPNASHLLLGTILHVEAAVIIDPDTGQPQYHRLTLTLDNGASLDIALTPDAMRTLAGAERGPARPPIQGGPVPLS